MHTRARALYALPFRVLILGLVLGLVLPAASCLALETGGRWTPWVDAEGDWGTHRSIGQLDVFAPVSQNDSSLLFVNPRFRFDDQDSDEINLGLGYRALTSDWVLGGYAYFDREKTVLNDYFSQATLGGEALGRDWKARINLYQTLGTRTYTLLNPRVISTGAGLQIATDSDRALSGFDGEIGYRVPIYDAAALEQLWVYAGGYRFAAPGASTVAGPRIRAEYEVADLPIGEQDIRVRVSGEIEHDSVRGTQEYLGLRIGIPIGQSGSPSRSAQNYHQSDPLARHMIDPVRRDVDIVSESATVTEAIASADAVGLGPVTIVHAGDDVSAKVTAAGDNSIVVFDGSGGPILSSAPITMANGQTFYGGGLTLTLVSAKTGLSISYTVGGAAPQLVGSFAGSFAAGLINLANNDTIRGLTVSNTSGGSGGAYVLYGNNASNFSVSGNVLVAPTRSDSVVFLAGNSSGSLSGNTISTNGANAKGVYNLSQGAVSVANNVISASGNASYGIQDQSGAAGVSGRATITGNSITMSGNNSEGIYTQAYASVISGNTIAVTGASVAGGRPAGLDIEDSAGAAVSNNAITTTAAQSYGVNAVVNTGLSGSGNSYAGSGTFCHDGGLNSGSLGFTGGAHCP